MYELFVWTSETVRYIRVRIRSGGGGGHSLIWPRQICAAEHDMVFKVPHRVYNFTVASSTGCVLGPEAFISEIVKPEYEQSTFVAPSKKLSFIILV